MNTRILHLIDLKKVVKELENDLGFGSMSSHEKAVLLAITDLQQLDGVAKTKAILTHELTDLRIKTFNISCAEQIRKTR